MNFHCPAPPGVLAAQPEEQFGLIALDLCCRQGSAGQRFPEAVRSPFRPHWQKWHSLHAVVAGHTACLGKCVHPDAERLCQAVPVGNIHAGGRSQAVQILPPAGLLDAERVVRTVGGQDFGVKTLFLRDLRMVRQRIRRVLGGAQGVHIGLPDKMLGRMLPIRKNPAGLFPDLRRRFGVQRLVDPEIPLQLQMGPVVDRIPDGVGQRLGVGHEFVVITGIPGDIQLVDPVAPHRAPLVVVAQQPELRQILRRTVLADLFCAQVAMVVDDRLILGVLVVQSLRCFALQHEILIHKRFHAGAPPSNASRMIFSRAFASANWSSSSICSLSLSLGPATVAASRYSHPWDLACASK